MATYVLFDTETTGNQERDRIIQIGAFIIYNKEHIEVYNELCSASLPISVEAMEVHNITPDMIEHKAPFIETDFYTKLQSINQEENYLIAHNIDFDLGMLKKEGFVNNFTLIDTLRCSKHLYPDMPYHRLQYFRYALELYKDEVAEAKRVGETIKAHDAIGDVIVMKLLLSKLVKEVQRQFPESDIMAKLAELTVTPVLMKTFKFGKYKGESIEEISHQDRGYIAWMQKSLELDEDMQYTLDYYS